MAGPFRCPPASRRRWPLVLAGCTLAFSTGCSFGSTGSTATTTTSSTPATTTTTLAPGTPTTAPPQTLRLGDDLVTKDGNTVRVFAYVQPVRSRLVAPSTNAEYGAAEAEICAGARGARRVSPEAFSVELSDGTSVGRSFFGPKEPLLADARLEPRGCVRGWVNFEVPADERPAFVVFDGSTVGQWDVGGGRGT